MKEVKKYELKDVIDKTYTLKEEGEDVRDAKILDLSLHKCIRGEGRVY